MSVKSLLKKWVGLISVLTLYGANVYTNRVTNASIIRHDSMTYDPVNNLIYTANYDTTGVPVIGKATYVPGVTNPNALVFTYVTAAVPASNVNDDHTIICLGVGANGRLVVTWGCHSTNLNCWVGSASGDITITTATMIGLNSTAGTPIVAGNTAVEAAATYPILRPTFSPAGDLLLIFRTGASGLGSWPVYRYFTASNTWVQVQASLFGSISDSIYLFTVDYDLSGRLYFAWQVRDSNNPIDAHDLFYAKTDNDCASMQAVDGTAMTIPITSANASAALVQSIPKPTTNYDAAQGLTHDARRLPIIGYYITEETSPGVFQTFFYAVRRNNANTGWSKVALSLIAAPQTYVSRPFILFYRGTTYLFFVEAISGISVGLTCIYSRNADLSNPQRVQVDSSNWGQSSPTTNKQLWYFGGQLQFEKLNCGLNPGVPPNQAGILTVTLP